MNHGSGPKTICYRNGPSKDANRFRTLPIDLKTRLSDEFSVLGTYITYII